MSHPVVLALYSNAAAAAAGARAAHAAGVSREQLSVVARTHDEEGALAEQMGGTPGADIEDSRPAGVLGELSGFALAAMAIVMPGIGPIVAAGPLAAGLGEAAGHVAGSVASVMRDAGIPDSDAEHVERRIESGAVLLGIHSTAGSAERVRTALAATNPDWLSVADWQAP
jgi:hypothetical protein